MKIKIFTTGGSIDKGYSTRESAFVVMDPTIDIILGDAGVSFRYEVESLLQKDSLEITEADRELIFRKVQEEPSRRILITHGTDTVVETGRRLSSIPDKTIVLTGAMQPAMFKYSDAQFNIGFAVAAAQLLPPGVYMAINGKIFDPCRTEKIAAEDRFAERVSE